MVTGLLRQNDSELVTIAGFLTKFCSLQVLLHLYSAQNMQ